MDMKFFLHHRPDSEADVDRLVATRPAFIRMPMGRYKMLTMPEVIWEAYNYAIEGGFTELQIARLTQLQARSTQVSFEVAFPLLVHGAASAIRDRDSQLEA